jgi:hypothetical protein
MTEYFYLNQGYISVQSKAGVINLGYTDSQEVSG